MMPFHQTEETTSEGERACLCPWHEDRHPSLFINLEKDVAICFAGCYSGSARGAVQKLLGYSPNRPEKAFVFAPLQHREWSFPYSSGREELDGISYMHKRGFTTETLVAWKITYDKERACVTIPAYRRTGELAGTIWRQVAPETLPKYLYSPGFRVSHFLFGAAMLDPFPPPVIHVVEGPLDCVWLWQNHYPAVALLGSSMSVVQRRMLARISPHVVLCLDNDPAGAKATRMIGSSLAQLGFSVSTTTLLQGKKDVQEHSAEELRTVLEASVPYLKQRLTTRR